MEPKKDIQASQLPDRDSRNLLIFELFEKDNYFLFIYKKTERIVSALYLVSNLLSDKEPIRWQFRSGGVAVIALLMSLTAKPVTKADIGSVLAPELLQMLSLLDISYTAGLVSEMNFSILKRELESLLDTLNYRGASGQGNVSRSVIISKEFFEVPREHFKLDNASVTGESGATFLKGEMENKGQDGGINSWADVLRERVDGGILKGQMSLKDKGISLKNTRTGSVSGTVDKGQNPNRRMEGTSRQTEILKLVRGRNNLTIRDFSQVIKDCSEKTIQRELLRLVKLGVLNKVGERRWSRYSLALA